MRAAAEMVLLCKSSNAFWTEYLRTWSKATTATDGDDYKIQLESFSVKEEHATDEVKVECIQHCRASDDGDASPDGQQPSIAHHKSEATQSPPEARRSRRHLPKPSSPIQSSNTVESKPPSKRPAGNGQVCHICGGRYLKMDRHIEAAHSELECDLCGQTFNHKVPLRRHFRDTHGFQRYTCDVCRRPNLTRSLWLRHQERHRPQKERLFACDQCGQQYPTLHNLRQHVARVHVHQEVVCPECGKLFHNAVRLREHMIRHRPKAVVCPEAGCPRMFWLVKEMKEHCRTVHEKDRKYGCEVCGKRFLVNAQLKKHHALGRCRGADDDGMSLRRRQQQLGLAEEVVDGRLEHCASVGDNLTISLSFV